MSINLTISADSADDFFTHLRGLNEGFGLTKVTYVASAPIAAHAPVTTVDDAPTVTVTATDAETTAAPEPKAARKPRAAKTEAPVEGKATADTATTQAGSTETQTSGPVDAPREEPASASDKDEGREGPYPDFDTEVTPVVLGAVRAKGKEWVSAILGEFGVDKASQLADNRFQDLIDTINDRLA